MGDQLHLRGIQHGKLKMEKAEARIVWKILQQARSLCSCAGFGNDWVNGLESNEAVDVPKWLVDELYKSIQEYESKFRNIGETNL